MAETRKDKVFRTAVISRAVSTVDSFHKNSTPGVKDLVNISKIGNADKRNEEIKNTISSYSSNLNKTLSSTIDDNVKTMARTLIMDEAKKLSAKGIYLSAEQVDAMAKDYIAKSQNQKFLGKTRKQRVDAISKRVESDMTNGVRKMRFREDKDAYAKKILDTTKGKRRGYYSEGRKFVSLSSKRSSERLVVSEIARARRESVSYFAGQIGVRFVRWVNSGDSKVCPICLAFSKAITVNENVFPDMRGIYYTWEVPHSHPYCRCRIELMVAPQDDFTLMAQGKVEEFLGDYNGVPLSTEESSEYFKHYVEKRKESFKLAELPPAEAKAKITEYENMIETGSLVGGEKIDRMFMGNAKRGQLQAIKDLQKVLGEKVVPDELLNIIGTENAVRVLMRNVPKSKIGELSDVFKDSAAKRLKASTEVIDAHISSAEKYKAASKAAQRKKDQALYRNLSANDLNKARVEAGQSLGYVDGQNRMLNQLKNKSDKLVVSFRSKDDLDDFIQRYPNKWKIYRDNRVVTLDIKEADSLIKRAEALSDDRKRVNAIRAGKYNKGDRYGYHPLGTKDTFTQVDQDGVKRTRKFRLSSEQETAMRFLKDQKSVILNAAPGTGKTPMSMSAVSELIQEGHIQKKVLYVTKNKLEGQVVKEWDKFIGDGKAGFGVSVDDRKAMYADPNKRLNVVSHNSFLEDVKSKRVNPAEYDAIIVDEFQLMGPEARKSLLKFNGSEYKFMLSGTPVNNNVNELWDIIKFVDPKLFRMKSEFVKLFSKSATSTTFFQDSVYREINDKMYGTLITQKQTKLKPFEYKEITSKLTGKNRAAIAKMENDYLNNPYYQNNPTRKAKLRKRQQDFLDGDLKEKALQVKGILENEQGAKKVIFVKNADQFDMVAGKLKSFGVNKDSIFTLGTSTAKDKVEVVKSAFRASTDENAVIILDATSRVGHDFPFAEVVVNWAPAANYSTWLQGTARTWRIGNKRTKVYDLYTDTAEDVKRKRKMQSTRKVFTAFADAEGVDDTGFLSILKEEILE